ncbi:MAG: hypothetical protein IPK79_06390 [Vampirovibrionales bacterium]|nr:hypothetical protein [Vampirovibrionales bacterium]
MPPAPNKTAFWLVYLTLLATQLPILIYAWRERQKQRRLAESWSEFFFPSAPAAMPLFPLVMQALTPLALMPAAMMSMSLTPAPEPPQIAYFEAQIVARAAEERGMTPATLSQAMHRVLKERHLAVLQPYSPTTMTAVRPDLDMTSSLVSAIEASRGQVGR